VRYLSVSFYRLYLQHGFPCCVPALAPVQVGDTVFASDANSTAYKYPLADANILSVKGKPAGEQGGGRGELL
jgi:hypothetical protein